MMLLMMVSSEGTFDILQAYGSRLANVNRSFTMTQKTQNEPIPILTRLFNSFFLHLLQSSGHLLRNFGAMV
jgi:hypothetical protein